MKLDNLILLHVDLYLILLCKNNEVIKLVFRMAFYTVMAVIEVCLSNNSDNFIFFQVKHCMKYLDPVKKALIFIHPTSFLAISYIEEN